MDDQITKLFYWGLGSGKMASEVLFSAAILLEKHPINRSNQENFCESMPLDFQNAGLCRKRFNVTFKIHPVFQNIL